MSESAKLDAAMETLGAFPLPELFTMVCQLTMPPDVTIDEKKERTRLAMAGHFATTKVHHYIGIWRQIDGLRHQIGKEIHDLFSVKGGLPSDHEDADLIDATTNELSGKQEVTYHLYAVCAAQVGRLLPYAAKAAGVKLTANERRLVTSFDDLRDHFEHIDQRLPGNSRLHFSTYPDRIPGRIPFVSVTYADSR